MKGRWKQSVAEFSVYSRNIFEPFRIRTDDESVHASQDDLSSKWVIKMKNQRELWRELLPKTLVKLY